MNVKEFRVGNLIEVLNPKTGIWVVETLNAKSIYNFQYNPDHKLVKNNFKPVSLNDEWVLKFKIGSIIQNDGIINKTICFRCFPMISWKDGSVTIFINDFCEVKLNYVHEMQNLHYALTGTELIES